MRGYGEAKPDLMIGIKFKPPGLKKKDSKKKDEEEENGSESYSEAAQKRLTKKYGSKK